MGTKAIGAMIVAGPEGFLKNQLPQVQHQADAQTNDDFGDDARGAWTGAFAARSRRTRTADTTGHRGALWPDLVLIDGGKGQISSG